MPDVTLVDYLDEDVSYLFSPSTGILTFREKAESDELHGAGYASRKRVGVLRFHVITVAVFCEGTHLVLWIPGIRVDLCSNSFQGKVRLVAPFVREFSLTQGERVLYSCFYWHSGARAWPDDGDIFSYVKRVTSSPEAVARAHGIWTAILAGQPFTHIHT